MDKGVIKNLLLDFEGFSQKTENGIEFWLARDLQYLLGYSKWDNFLNVILKAKTSCDVSGDNISDHFADVGKMVKLGSGSERDIEDLMLTRYACYLIAQNGDSSKEQIAFAQRYFATQTRKLELIEQKILDYERVKARHKLTETEKDLSKIIFEQNKSDRNFGLIRSKGDSAFFGGKTTGEMKKVWNIKDGKPLADHMPTILLKAKDFATEITIHNAKVNKMSSEGQISLEHITNNSTVRETLISRGITPENLEPEEDVKKVERSLNKEEKKLNSKKDKLG